jgi:hypothetical protein
VVTGADSVTCSDNEVLVSIICSSGAPDGAKCPASTATGVCARK